MLRKFWWRRLQQRPTDRYRSYKANTFGDYVVTIACTNANIEASEDTFCSIVRWKADEQRFALQPYCLVSIESTYSRNT